MLRSAIAALLPRCAMPSAMGPRTAPSSVLRFDFVLFFRSFSCDRHREGPSHSRLIGQAEAIFQHVLSDPRRTAVVIDPPRAGCSDLFIAQLLRLRPARVVYVSCSPATQVTPSYIAVACPQKTRVSSPMYHARPS